VTIKKRKGGRERWGRRAGVPKTIVTNKQSRKTAVFDIYRSQSM